MIQVKYINDVYMRVRASGGIEHDIMEFFSFYVDGYKFMPKYKNKQWSGKINLYTPYQQKMYIGLLATLVEYAKMMDHEISIDKEVARCFYSGWEQEKILNFIDSLDFRNKGEIITPWSHQIQAIVSAITLNRLTLLSGTSSGKSLIAYVLCRWHMEDQKRILIITDSVMLVDQLVSDFDDYSSHDDQFDAESSCHKIYSGQDKNSTKSIVVTTWQSAMKQSKAWFSQFDVVINDEVHKAKSTELKNIHEKMDNCKYKIGMTGTLDNSECNKLVIAGLFGPVQQFVTIKQLMDRGVVANLQIRPIVLNYNDKESRLVRKSKYQDEIKFITKHEVRNNKVKDLAIAQGDNKNTLILANNVAHCRLIYKKLSESLEEADRNVYLITGSVGREARNEIKTIVETEDGAVIVATYGCLSTGVSIKRIHSLIFASPTKSIIRTLQSIGRGLRKAHDKYKVTLYDIVDDLRIGKHENYAYKHFIERLKIYNREKFDYKINKLDL